MGKKKEKIEIRLSDEELMPVTIGVLEETKSSSVGLIIIFAIFTLFAVFLPNISEWVNKLLGKDTGVIVTPNNGNADKEKEKEEQKAVMHDLSENLEFTYDDIKFSKFNVYENNNKYYISINLSNTSDTVIDLGDKKYYLETYS